jgi:hypothetical protein
MTEVWNQSPWLIALGVVAILAAFVAVIFGFLKNRGYRHIERMRAMELNRVAESFFSGRLLAYIPWQFWTSFAILVILIASAMITSDGDTRKVFLELTKYVTGAVIGSLFGKGNTGVKADGGAAEPDAK